MKLGEKLARLFADPKTATIILFAVVVGTKTAMILGGGYRTDGTVIG